MSTIKLSCEPIRFLTDETLAVKVEDVASYFQQELLDVESSLKALLTELGAFEAASAVPLLSLGDLLLRMFSRLLALAIPVDVAVAGALSGVYSLPFLGNLISPSICSSSTSTCSSSPDLSFRVEIARVAGERAERLAWAYQAIKMRGLRPYGLRLEASKVLHRLEGLFSGPLSQQDLDDLACVDLVAAAELSSGPLLPAAALSLLHARAMNCFAGLTLLLPETPSPAVASRACLSLLVFGPQLPPDGAPLEILFSELVSPSAFRSASRLCGFPLPDQIARAGEGRLRFDAKALSFFDEEEQNEKDRRESLPPVGFVLQGEQSYGMSTLPFYLLTAYHGKRCTSLPGLPSGYPLRVEFLQTAAALPRPLPAAGNPEAIPVRLFTTDFGRAAEALVDGLARFGWAGLVADADGHAAVQAGFLRLLELCEGEHREITSSVARCGARAVGFMCDSARKWLQLRPDCRCENGEMLGWSEEARAFAGPLLRCCELLHATGQTMMRAVASVLQLACLDDPAALYATAAPIGPSVLRLLYYQQQDRGFGSGPHCDMGLLTLSPASTRPALAVHHPASLEILH